MPLTAPIYADFDERSAAEAMARAERVVSDGARDMGRSFTNVLGGAVQESGRDIERMAEDARVAFRRVGDATDDVAEREESLQRARRDGADGAPRDHRAE